MTSPSRLFLRLLTCALWLAPASAVHAQCQYEVTAIVRGPSCSFGGTAPVTGLSLNNRGEWVGYVTSCTGGTRTAVKWTAAGGLQTLTLPGSFDSQANDLTDDGRIVGSQHTQKGGDIIGKRGFYIDEKGNYTRIDPLAGGNYAEAMAISNNGKAVGTWGNISTGRLDAFFWNGGKIIDLAPQLGTPFSFAFDVNDDSVITGWMGFSKLVDARAFIIADSNMIVLNPPPDWVSSEGWAVNSRCHVAGRGFVQAGEDPVWRGILWIDGDPIDLGTLPGTSRSISRDLNCADQVVGYCHNAFQADITPFLWQDGVMYDLNQLIEADSDVSMSIAYGINDNGQILASASQGADGVIVVLTPMKKSVADITNDCNVDESDLLLLFDEWNKPNSIADISADGKVDVIDLFKMLAHWG